MRRNALCIGINDYPGIENDLKGCVNDADDWAHLFQQLGFNASILENAQATKRRIVAAVKLAVASLQGPGDVCVVSYSGHGTWVPDFNGDEPDGKDEAICPYDMGDGENLLIDDEIHTLLDARPKGARVVLITDSCHSGSVFRYVNSPYAPQTRIKYLPAAHFVKCPKVLAAVEKLGPHGLASDSPLPGIIHFAGCRDAEYSYDASFDGRPNGAFTRFAREALARLSPAATYADFSRAIGAYLPCAEYPQSPRLNAVKSDRLLPLFT